MNGRHIKILGRGDREPLGSTESIDRFLSDLVEKLGMSALGNPHVYEAVSSIEQMGTDAPEEEGGITGVIVISTAYCVMRTWPLRHLLPNNREMFSLDVCSATRYFSTESIVHLVRARFNAFNLKTSDLSSYLLYP